MPSSYSRERLQPSLLDRLDDSLAPVLLQLGQDRRALEQLLDGPQRAALASLLNNEHFDRRSPGPDVVGPFASLGQEARMLLDRVLRLEDARRQQIRRTVLLSAAELRAAVLRDLRSLLNTTAAEALPDEGRAALLRYPAVLSSVVNYGIPALAGHVRTMDDFLELAQQIERAIECYEPRLRHVRVRPTDDAALAPGLIPSPLDLVIEGELWGYPVPEHLLVRTILDLDAGHVDIIAPEQAA